MGYSIILAPVILVLTGLLFGFNIKVSNSAVALINSLGTIIGGIGAAIAAYISFRSMGQWKEEFRHSKAFESLSELSEALDELFEQFRKEALSDQSENKGVFEQLSLVASMVQPLKKNYRHHYNNAQAALSVSNIQKLDRLEINLIAGELNEIYYSYIESYQAGRKLAEQNDHLTLSEIPGIRPHMQNMFAQQLKFSTLQSECITSLQDMKSAL
ncbi:hypothetical protein [Vibrio crassostreae]|uniref:hypothetical protein n=1 Tax=Vibrio crassostreae TaxID=246167 RepID=UPI000F4957DE|nr:hypothetical protein [Vibrio crassostreae]ROS69275.1 hypothetical protein EDB73_10273 [Vibrio crassostreae]TCN88767.1 hypothetical protein EDB65_102555 [Vibrio crassostreae]CAK2572501.1 putative 5-bromo-4-chloroindolyl phosphate hydrolysis protein [Vibrio crassostreae]